MNSCFKCDSLLLRDLQMQAKEIESKIVIGEATNK